MGVNTMSSEIARPEGSAFDLLKAAADPKARMEAARYAVEAIPVPDFKFPVPRMFFDLPWSGDDAESFDAILAQMAGAEDIEAATSDAELTDPYDIIGVPVTVFGVIARKSDLEDSRWGAYLALTASVDGGEPETINTGAGEVCVVMWRLYCEGRLPAHGVFDVKGEKKKGRKQPLTFRVESPLAPEAESK